MRQLTTHGKRMWRVKVLRDTPRSDWEVQTFDNAKDADAAWVAAIKSPETYHVAMEEYRTIAEAIR